MSGDTKEKKVNIKLDESVANGQYGNLAVINHSPDEFVVDFIFMQPGGQQGQVLSRTILTPGHAKRFLTAMQQNIERYEKRFGRIREDIAQGPDIDETQIN